MDHRLLFGPVPSRRLGLSLGVDLVPYKVCSMDCVYCECGGTTTLTTKRQEFFPLESILGQLDDYLKEAPHLDYITLTGSGEPTLNSCLGKVIAFLKEKYSQYKICLITNSTLLGDPQVRKEILEVDLVMPSLDGATAMAFEGITRVDVAVDFEKMVKGLIAFSKEFKGDIWLEVFVVAGINDNREQMAAIADIAKKMAPVRVQLNALDRPGTENWVKKPSLHKMEELALLFDPLRVEIISKYKEQQVVATSDSQLSQKIVEILRRRPCTLDDLCQATGSNDQKISESLQQLMGQNSIVSRYQERGLFYFLKNS